MDLEKQKITLGVMAVSEEKRNHGYARKLINEFEKRCKAKVVLHIDLGSRLRACGFYKLMGYRYSLMI